jgi:hypothetical protein
MVALWRWAFFLLARYTPDALRWAVLQNIRLHRTYPKPVATSCITFGATASQLGVGRHVWICSEKSWSLSVFVSCRVCAVNPIKVKVDVPFEFQTGFDMFCQAHGHLSTAAAVAWGSGVEPSVNIIQHDLSWHVDKDWRQQQKLH